MICGTPLAILLSGETETEHLGLAVFCDETVQRSLSLHRIHPHELGRVQLLLSVKTIAGKAAAGGNAVVQATNVAPQQLGRTL